MKPYLPYLPMLAIMAGGIAVDRSWEPGNHGQAAVSAGTSVFGETSRLELLSGSSAVWLSTLVAVVALAALALFMARNGLRFHRLLVRSEHFITSHGMLDIATVAVFTAGFVLLG